MTTSGGASGVVDVASGQSVLLKLDSGVVHGYINLGGPDIDVFTVSVNASGLTTLTQQRAIQHTDVAPASDNSPDPTGLSGLQQDRRSGHRHGQGRRHQVGHLDLTPAIQFTDGQPSISAQAAGANTLVADR
jgi:hypothetical protein